MQLKSVQIFVLSVFCMMIPLICGWDECMHDEGRYFCRFFGSEEFLCQLSQVPIAGVYQYHYPMTQRLMDTILEEHNNYRNLLASGETKDGSGKLYPAAKRLRTLIWDAELEYIDWIHAQRCNMLHPKCVSTRIYPYVGQNLGWVSSPFPETAYVTINHSTLGWWVEKNLLNGPTAWQKTPTSLAAGHFTLMISEHISRVGCGMTFCTDCKPEHHYCYYISCGYDFTNLVGAPIYHPGEPASDCEHWDTVPDEKYPNLCKNTGKNFKPNLTMFN